MEFIYELLFTIFFAFFFSLLVAKLVSIASTETCDASQARAQSSEIERRSYGGTKPDEDEAFDTVGGDGDRYESSGTVGEKTETTGVDDVAVGRRCGEGVDGETERVRAEDETVDNLLGGCDKIESSGTVGEKTEENKVDDVAFGRRFDEGVDEETEHARVEDETVDNLRGDCDNIESSGTVGEKTEEIEFDDVAVERRCEEVKLAKLDGETGNNSGGDLDSVETLGTICEKIENTGVDEVAVEEEFDYVDGVVGEHSNTEDEIVKDIRGDGDSFESSGTVCERVEKAVVDDVVVTRCEEVKSEEFNDADEEYLVNKGSDERFIGHLIVDGTNVKDVGGVGDSFGSSGINSDILEKIETEGDSRVNSGDSDPDDDVAVEERSKMREFVEQEWTTDDTLKSSGANNDIIESIGVEGDIMVNCGKNNHDVASEVSVEGKSDKRELDEFENVGVNNVNSENSGTNAESVENVLVGGDIKLSRCNDVDEDGDWEGIERSELEESFAAAANYVFRGDKNVPESKLDNNVIMELYGLSKVALEGPCREAQPLAILVSARAKWFESCYV